MMFFYHCNIIQSKYLPCYTYFNYWASRKYNVVSAQTLFDATIYLHLIIVFLLCIIIHVAGSYKYIV